MITIDTDRVFSTSKPGRTFPRARASIIGRYALGDQVRCGLKNCHTMHNHGYIVTAENGQETNIGKDCGKRYFSVDFEQVKRQFDRDMDAMENRDLLWSLTFKLGEIGERIMPPRAGAKGADWIFKNCTEADGNSSATDSSFYII